MGVNKHFQKTMLEQYKFSKQKKEQEAQIGKPLPIDKMNSQDGSTLLYFSTANDPNSSKSSDGDESFDSNNLNEKQIFLDNIMLPESLICFKIIDIFSVQSERIHEFLSCNWGIFETGRAKEDETERIFIRGVPVNNFDEDSLRDVKKNSSI